MFPYIQQEPPVFQFVTIVFCPVAGHHLKEPDSVIFTASLQILVHLDEIPPDPSLLWAKQSQISKPFLLWEML